MTLVVRDKHVHKLWIDLQPITIIMRNRCFYHIARFAGVGEMLFRPWVQSQQYCVWGPVKNKVFESKMDCIFLSINFNIGFGVSLR